MAIETYFRTLPHNVTLSCRAAGQPGRPVLMFIHGFPEAAFVWDELMLHFAQEANGGYRCVAPNLRGFERSSAPQDASAYRPKHLVQDIAALIALETEGQGGKLACLVAHDWGGAVAWNLANQQPQLMQRLAILNSPHPGTFLRELKSNPRQQAASAYMNALIQPDAEANLMANDFRQLFETLTKGWGSAQAPAWLTETVKNQYREVWALGLTGGCNLYRASPLRPPRPEDAAAASVDLPHSMLAIQVPTLVVWGMRDTALCPELTHGLEAYIPDLTLHPVADASHWIAHEQPQLVARRLGNFLSAA
jgi:pimeloyl-ACP methyl ester carboxylesterase